MNRYIDNSQKANLIRFADILGLSYTRNITAAELKEKIKNKITDPDLKINNVEKVQNAIALVGTKGVTTRKQ